MNDWISFLLLLITLALIILFVWRSRNQEKKALPGPDGQKPYGVGGWLWFFIAASYYLGPIVNAGRLNSELLTADIALETANLSPMSGWFEYKVASWSLVAVMVVWQWRAAYLLKHRYEPSSVRFVKTLLVASPLVTATADYVMSRVLLDLSNEAGLAEGLAVGFVQSGLWFAYFHFSRRVKNTYYSRKVVDPVDAESA
jgi:hypothetical protein